MGGNNFALSRSTLEQVELLNYLYLQLIPCFMLQQNMTSEYTSPKLDVSKRTPVFYLVYHILFDGAHLSFEPWLKKFLVQKAFYPLAKVNAYLLVMLAMPNELITTVPHFMENLKTLLISQPSINLKEYYNEDAKYPNTIITPSDIQQIFAKPITSKDPEILKFIDQSFKLLLKNIGLCVRNLVKRSYSYPYMLDGEYSREMEEFTDVDLVKYLFRVIIMGETL